jgi:two-component system, cell cycle response regulator
VTEEDFDEGEITCVASRAELFGAKQLAALAAKPVMHPYPYLVVVAGQSVGRMFRLEGEMTVGRAPNAELRFDEEGVSRRHARVATLPDGTVELRDLGSTNGTIVNDEPVQSRLLKDGDRVAIGNTSILKFSYRDAVEETQQQNLYRSATRDALTGVHNRRWFDEALGSELAFSRRHVRPLSLLLLDIDFFKRINDTHGHPGGDRVLAAIGELVSTVVRREDAVARYGGEEFAILLRDTDGTAARACAERIRRAIETATITHMARTIPVTASIGVATVRGATAGTSSALIDAADRCLYQAKERGRNRVEGGESS